MTYFRRSNEDIFVAVAIETKTGVENLEKILTVEGLDAIFIGPVDLAASFGYLTDPHAPLITSIIKDIEKQVLSTKKFLGTVARGDEDILSKFNRGYNFLTVISDVIHLSQESHRLVSLVNTNYTR